MISEALGKILGMAMAYGVSSLGLLLAYYNYRKRIVKAETIFTPTAKCVIAVVVVVALVALIGGAVHVGKIPWAEAIPGIVIPAAVIAFAFWVTWALYNHFSRKLEEHEE